MFSSMLELIIQATSNSLFIFCFCNLIIVIILLGSKSSYNSGREAEIPLSAFIDTPRSHKLGLNRKQFFDDDEMPRDVNIEVSYFQQTPSADKEVTGSSNNKDENDDAELRRRVEKFIEKVNEGWKAELLRR